MLNRIDRRLNEKKSIKNQLTKKYGIQYSDMINQILDNGNNLIYTDKIIKEIENTLKKKINDTVPTKPKLLVKPHIAERIKELKAQIELSNNSYNKSTQLETDRDYKLTPFNTDRKNKNVEITSIAINLKPDGKKRVISDKFDITQRKRHTVMGIPVISSKELNNNLDVIRRVQQDSKKSPFRMSLARSPNPDHHIKITSNISSQQFMPTTVKESLDELGPIYNSRTKPKSLLKNPSHAKSPTINRVQFDKLNMLYIDRVKSNNIDDEVLKDIDSSLSDLPFARRGRSTGNFITGRDNNSIKRLVERASIDISNKDLSDIDMNLELDEIKEIVSGEGSFISQDMFKPKKPEKKEPKTACNRKSQHIRTNDDNRVKRMSLAVNTTPKKPVNAKKDANIIKELSAPSKYVNNRPSTFIKKSGTKNKLLQKSSTTPIEINPLAGIDELIKDFAIPYIEKKDNSNSICGR